MSRSQPHTRDAGALRRTCPHCGSGRLRWFDHIGNALPAIGFEALAELVDQLRAAAPDRSVEEGLDWWLCLGCGDSGVLTRWALF